MLLAHLRVHHQETHLLQNLLEGYSLGEVPGEEVVTEGSYSVGISGGKFVGKLEVSELVDSLGSEY